MKKILFIALILSLLLVMAVPVMADSHCEAPGNAHQSIAKCLGGEVVSSVSPCHQLAGGPGKGTPPQCAN